MGIMICETHGRVGFVEACSHVAKEIERKLVPDGHRLTIMGNLFVCDGCFRSLGFERFASLAELPFEEVVGVTDGRWEAFDMAYEAIEGRQGFCLECLAELETQSRATALPIAEPGSRK
jgi:hypothetical protein